MIKHDSRSMKLSAAAKKVNMNTIKLIERLISKKIQIYALPKAPELGDPICALHLVDFDKLRKCLASKNYINEYTAIVPDDPRDQKHGFEYKFTHSLDDLMVSSIELSKLENYFIHSSDYASVQLDGIDYVLTKAQRQVVKLLHEAFLSGAFGLRIFRNDNHTSLANPAE